MVRDFVRLVGTAHFGNTIPKFFRDFGVFHGFHRKLFMVQAMLICESCGKRLIFPTQLAGTSLPCPFCGHVVAVPKSSRPPPSDPAANKRTKIWPIVFAVVSGIVVLALVAFLLTWTRLYPPSSTSAVTSNAVAKIAVPVQPTIPKDPPATPIPLVMPGPDPVKPELVPASQKITESAGKSTLRTTPRNAGQVHSTTEKAPATNAGVAGPSPAGNTNTAAPLLNEPVQVIVRVNEFAAVSNGPWTINLPLGEDFGNYRFVFVDFTAKPIATQVHRTGGKINKISELGYAMPRLGLSAKIMSSGISIERSKDSKLTIPLSSLLTFIRIERAGGGDIIIWTRGLNITSCPAKETESGFTLNVLRKAIPDAWRFILNTNALDCHASFKGLAKPEVCDFQITETATNLVVNLLLDENQRDTIWEALQALEPNPAGTAPDTAAPSATTGSGINSGGSDTPDASTIASVSATLRFCEKGKPDEALLVITTQQGGTP